MPNNTIYDNTKDTVRTEIKSKRVMVQASKANIYCNLGLGDIIGRPGVPVNKPEIYEPNPTINLFFCQ